MKLLIHIQPGAAKNEVVGFYGEPARIKIKVKARPVEGEANAEVISFLAKILGIAKSRIEIERGHTSRQKDLMIDLPEEEVMKRLKLPYYNGSN